MFESIQDGICLIELVDAEGAPPQLIPHNVNSAFQNLLGVTSAAGQPLPGMLTALQPELLALCRLVAETGIAEGSETEIRATGRWCSICCTPLNEPGEGQLFVVTLRDISREKRLVERHKFVVSEIRRQIRNTLALIRSIVRRSAPNGGGAEENALRTQGRIEAVARVQVAVMRDPERGIDLELLIWEELRRIGLRDSTRIEGPQMALSAEAAGTIGLAIHELVANSAEFGALSTSAGKLAITWEMVRSGGEDWWHFVWDESGMRDLAQAERIGFGTEVLGRTLPYELDARTEIDYRPTGIHCRIEVPLQRLLARFAT
jgi:two-component sensor histidine kinase